MLYADEVYQIQGAIFEVNRQLGAGFLEGAYQECLEMELTERGIPFVANQTLTIANNGQRLRATRRT